MLKKTLTGLDFVETRVILISKKRNKQTRFDYIKRQEISRTDIMGFVVEGKEFVIEVTSDFS